MQNGKQKMMSEIESLEAQIAQFRGEKFALEERQRHVVSLRRKLTTDAMIAQTTADISANNMEICKAEADVERSLAADDAIKILEARIKGIQNQIDDIDRAELIEKLAQFPKLYGAADAKRRAAKEKLAEAQSESLAADEVVHALVRDNLQGKIEKSVRGYEDVALPRLTSLIGEASAVASSPQSEGISLVTSGEAELVRVNKQHRNDVLLSAYSQIEAVLRPGAATAQVYLELFKDDAPKRRMLDLLKLLSFTSINAVRVKNLAVAEWAFSGANWEHLATEEQKASVRSFVQDCGLTLA